VSKTSVIRSLPPMPSTMRWWILNTIARGRPSSPSSSHSSRSGRAGPAAGRTASPRWPGAAPGPSGAGTRAYRTWWMANELLVVGPHRAQELDSSYVGVSPEKRA
jgi:hypothetical protein